jgi:hypothetical protein
MRLPLLFLYQRDDEQLAFQHKQSKTEYFYQDLSHRSRKKKVIQKFQQRDQSLTLS